MYKITLSKMKIAAVLAGVLVCAFSQSADAAGFIDFNVPLDVKTYPVSNTRVEVWCELHSLLGRSLEAGMSPARVVNGAVSGFVQVKVGYTPQEAPDIKNYRCALVADTGREVGIGSRASKSIPASATILSQVNGSFNH